MCACGCACAALCAGGRELGLDLRGRSRSGFSAGRSHGPCGNCTSPADRAPHQPIDFGLTWFCPATAPCHTLQSRPAAEFDIEAVDEEAEGPYIEMVSRRLPGARVAGRGGPGDWSR